MYHYADGDVSRGPVTRDALRGRITPQTLVWREGMAEWLPAGRLPELSDLFPPATLAMAEPAMAAEPIQPQQPSFGPAHVPQAQPVYSNQPPYGQGGGGALPYQTNHPMYAPAPGTATASMVLGIVGICLSCAWGLGLVCSILAIIFGYNARSQGAVGNNPGAGQATAGIIMGFIMVGLGVLGIGLFVIAIIFNA